MDKQTQQRVQEQFDANTEIDKLYVTSDGQGFPMKHDAYNHAQSLADDSIEEVGRSITNKDSKPSVAERIELYQTAETLEQLKILSEGETAKTALKAVEERKSYLEAEEAKQELLDLIAEADNQEVIDSLVEDETDEGVLLAAEARINELKKDQD